MNLKAFFLTLCISPLGFAVAANKEPVGLTNNHNSCFINASLQSLYAMDSLVDHILATQQQYKPDSISTMYLSHLNQIMHSGNKLINPQELSTEGWLMMSADPGTQQTADEFLSGLLNHLTDADIRDEVKAHLPTYPGTFAPLTPMSLLFYTLTSSQMFHEDSGFASNQRVEAHGALSLPVREHDQSLYQCISHLFDNGEEVTNYRLPNGRYVTAQRRHSLVETQPYLILTLKRTQPLLNPETREQVIDEDTQMPIMEKRTEAIRFPLAGLNIQHYFQDKKKNKNTYDLIAVIMHVGEDNAGHYVAYINKNNQWYFCNDDEIEAISDERMNAISERGYGYDDTVTPTLFIYEQSSSVQRRARLHPKPTVALPTPNNAPIQPYIPEEPFISQNDYVVEPDPVINSTPSVPAPYKAPVAPRGSNVNSTPLAQPARNGGTPTVQKTKNPVQVAPGGSARPTTQAAVGSRKNISRSIPLRGQARRSTSRRTGAGTTAPRSAPAQRKVTAVLAKRALNRKIAARRPAAQRVQTRRGVSRRTARA